MLLDRRIAAVLALAGVAVVVIAFLLGRSAAGGVSTATPAVTVAPNGVAVGTQPTRAGALSATDNYVTASTDSILADPAGYERFVRRVYVSTKVDAAVEVGRSLREENPNTIAAFAGGMQTTTWSAARKLISFTPQRAEVRTWAGSSTWGGSNEPTQSWALSRTVLVWQDDEWKVESMTADPALAPAPASVRAAGQSDATSTWKRELSGMTAPVYGAG